MRLYHLSMNPNLRTLIPRVPDNRPVKLGQEDGVNKRVCFGPSISHALMAVPHGDIGDIMYIYIPTSLDKRYIIKPTPDQVPWVSATHEIWYTAPVTVKKVGVLIKGDAKFLKLLHHPKNPELVAPTYKFNYKRFKNVPTKEERREYMKSQSEYQEERRERLKGFLLGAFGGLAVFALIGGAIRRLQ